MFKYVLYPCGGSEYRFTTDSDKQAIVLADNYMKNKNYHDGFLSNVTGKQGIFIKAY